MKHFLSRSAHLSLRPSSHSNISSIGIVLLLSSTIVGCGSHANFLPATPSSSSEVTLGGFVHGGQQPIIGASIQLWAAGTTADGSPATALLAAPVLTGSAGQFTIAANAFTCPTIQSEIYLTSTGGNPGLSAGTNNTASALVSALGPCGNLTSATHIVINEVSTIGSIYPITQFVAYPIVAGVNSYQNIGSSSADFNTMATDFMQIDEFINTDGGQSPGPTLPPGFSAPVTDLYTLANSMSDCVNSVGGVAGDGSPCGNFLLDATPPGGVSPTNTADAILDIANNPNNNVGQIFLLSSANPAFQPSLSAAPPNWTLKILPNITLTTPSNLVGIGSTNSGTITLGQAAPAGGLSIGLASDNPAAVTVVTPVNIGSGATTGTFSYTGVATGTADLTASATNYAPGTVTLSATASLISLGAIPTVAPGQSVDLPLSLGTPAPAGGVNINFSSLNTSIATVSPTVVNIAAGLKVPTANPRVTGVAIGNTQINATATGYAPGAQTVAVSVTASFPSTFTVPVGTPTNETLTISAPAPTGGITFNLSSDNTGIFTVPATVTIAAGATTANVPITGVAPGTTTLRADSTGITEATSSVSVNGTINLQTSAFTVGKLLQGSSYFYFAAAPPSAVTATVTSGTPSVAIVSSSATTVGGASATIPGITNTSAVTYYVQGVGVGTATLTISAPGYTNTNVTITVDPSGFVINSPGSITTTTLSSNSTLSIVPVILNPSTFAVVGYGAIAAPGGINIGVTSSTTATGTIVTSPITFVTNDTSEAATFQPAAAGTTTLSISTPVGFSTPTPSTTQQITATVTSPPIDLQTSAVTSGVGLEVSTYAYLSQTPLVPTTVTLTSANPAVAVVSTSPTAAGAGTTTFTSVVSTGALTFYVQGLSVGTTTITIAANPFTSATLNVTVDPSGFVISSPGSISTTSLSSASTVTAASAILTPGTLAVAGYASVIPQVSPVNVVLSSSNTAVGTIRSSPLVFTAGVSTASSNFQPVGAGSSTLSIATPGGFSTPTPASTQQITATVTLPPIDEQTGSVTTGINLQVSTYVYLSQTPLTPITVTIISDTPSVATVSPGAGIAGTASTTFPNTVNTSALTFSVQGQSAGTATLTASAPGYQSITIKVTVDPSGFVISSPGSISTTTFSSPSTVSIAPAFLTPGTLTIAGYAAFNPGISTISVTANSSATQVGTITSPATFSGGSSGQTLTFQPVAAGNTTISISTPAGYSTPSPASTQQITATVTAPPVSVQTTSVTTGTNLEIQTYAYLSQTPPSAVTVTVTSNNPSIATLSTSATVVGITMLTFTNVSGTGAQAFYVQGQAQGTTTITISAPGYSPATINVTVDASGFVLNSPGNFSTTTFSSATTGSIAPTILTPGTLTVVGYAALNPGVGSPQVVVTSSNTATGTVTSPVTFTAGMSSNTFTFQPVAAGTTTLSISTPTGFNTPSAAATQSITATVTAPPNSVQTGSVTTGVGLQLSTYAYLSQTPPSAVTVTVTSNNPAVAVISKSATVAGSASLNYTGVTGTGALSYYVQGTGVGTTTITITAPGFVNATVNIATDPAGFVISSPGSITTTTFSSASNISVAPVILNPGVLTVLGYAQLGPGGTVSVPVASSVPGVGTVTTPVVFNAGDSSDVATFQPVSNGSTTLSISTPAGFTTPSQSSTQSINATVSAPTISVQTGSLTAGVNLQLSTYTYLSVAPPSAVTVTVTSANPAIATVSPSATVVGVSSISFTGVSGTSALTYSLQGQSVGSTMLTISAPGFATTTVPVTVDPSGFVIYSPASISTTAASGSTTVTFMPAILNPGVLTVYGYGSINPGVGTVALSIGSTSLQIGTISPTTLNFPATAASATAQFTPLASGSTDIDIVSQPTGFTLPSQPVTQQIVATVQ